MAIVGFANFLLRFYADERPRAVIVGWDSLEAPMKRHEMFPAYQSGREFDEVSCPSLSPPLGLQTPKP
jgi:5'-3' exonuclease